jgi:hypothetical protein
MRQIGATGAPGQWEEYVEKVRAQVPAAPPGLLDGYCKYFPWVAIILGGLAFLFLLFAGLVTAIIALFAAFGGLGALFHAIFTFLGVILGLAGAGMTALGGYWMLKYKANGWWLVMLGLVVYAISDVLTINIIGLIIVILIAYLHVQVRPRYT